MAKTKAVDQAVRALWARLASHVAKCAAEHAKEGKYYDAETAMEWVEAWLNKAGARATNWNFRRPD